MNSSSGSGAFGDSPLSALVEGHKADIEALGARHRVSNVRVFGSVARGESHDLSDIDFLVDPPEDASLFDLSRFRRELAALLEVDVDVVSSRALLSRDHEILEQAVAL